MKELTAEDLVQSIATKYGPPMKPVAPIEVSKTQTQGPEEKVIANWGDAQFSVSLNRSYLVNGFTLILYSRLANAAACEAVAKAVKLEELEGPQKEVDRQKKEADDLAATRVKNLQGFRP